MPDVRNLGLLSTPQVEDIKCKQLNEGYVNPVLSDFVPQLGGANNQIRHTYQDEDESDLSMSTVKLFIAFDDKMGKLQRAYLKEFHRLKQ